MMSNNNQPYPEVQDHDEALRAQLAALLARYDCHLPPYIFAVVRQIETEISWSEHQRARP
jgi:hypothetical protein